jgi:hypothetical protein
MTKRALLIGIDEYAYVQSLNGCVNDIEAVAAVLTERYEFDPAHVRRLTSAPDNTREGILTALGQLIEQTQGDDVCVVYYAGHGSQAPDVDGDEDDGLDETIVPSDSGRGNYEVRDIVDDELHSHIVALAERTPHATFIFDSCHSGSVDRELRLLVEFGTPPGEPVPRAIRRASTAPTDRYIYPTSAPDGERSATGLMRQGDYLMIGGCRDPQTSKETVIDGATHGVLSYYLTKELREASPGTSLESVFARAAAQVKEEVTEQDPVLEGPEGWAGAAPFSNSAAPPARAEGPAGGDGDGGPGGPVAPAKPAQPGNPAQPAKPAVPAGPAKTDDDGKGKDAEPMEWDGKFAAVAAALVGLVLIAAIAGLAYLTHWALDNDSTSRDVIAVVIFELVAAGLVLAVLGAYIGLLEARGRARVLQASTDRSLTGDATAALKAYLEEIGKMPTARALIVVGGLAFIAATAFAWHVLPDSSEQEPPAIARQPVAVKTRAGGKASFQISANGSDLSYAWKRDGKKIARSSDSPKLFLSPVGKGENGDRISVIVSNDFGEAASKDAKLEVLPKKKGSKGNKGKKKSGG